MALLLEKSKNLHNIMLGHVYDSLKRNNGSRTKSAEELGVTIRCLHKWITKFEELEEFRKKRVIDHG